MKLQGIALKHTPKGRLKSVKINADTKSLLVEDIIDTIEYELHKDEPRVSLKDIMTQIDKKHAIKR